VIGLLLLPFRLVFGSVRFGWRAGRLVGPSRAAFFGAGFVVGVLATSPTARRAALSAVTRGVATVRAATEDPPPTELAPTE
jgi:hypothetical protein